MPVVRTNFVPLCEDVLGTRLFPNDADVLRSWYETFRARTYCPELDGYVPTPASSICGIPRLIERLFTDHDEVAVIALDSLSHEYFLDDICPAAPQDGRFVVGVLSSVFPSTSTTGWMSAVTGVPSWQHAVYGTSFYHETLGTNYIIGPNVSAHKGLEKPVPEDTGLRLDLSGRPTIFERLAQRGVPSYFIGYQEYEGPLQAYLREVTRGAELKRRRFDCACKLQPQQLIELLEEQTTELLHKPGRKLVWTHIDLDTFIHARGYEALSEDVSWSGLFEYIDANRRRGRVFLLVSDHGQTPQTHDSRHILDLGASNCGLACNVGGTGRCLYFHPNKGRENDVLEWLHDLYGNTARILHKQDLFTHRLLSPDAVGMQRVGDLVALARDPAFLSVGAPESVYEHGSVTEQEMFVPFGVVW